ncbi:hypothetical protein I6F09_16300 [Bradyrhizobium sp. IC3195]|uniref:hypothetical protein n=1 Tax=Bradyrhizobium sp. IC3195 TaxID=2793804 RepID=UPI001CD4415E|nr:hypothetical protein [Bradyrhizobium sp. IC3195]MCA1469456.1 hypothetical protein [Bradyrhizobium sp. IC3195]
MAYNQVKPSHDCVPSDYVFDLLDDIDAHGSAAHSVTPHRSRSACERRTQPCFRRARGIKEAAAFVNFGGGFLAADCRLGV